MRNRPTSDAFSEVLSELARLPAVGEGDLGAAFRAITESAARALEVRRANLWLFRDEGRQLECQDNYDSDAGRHESGAELTAARYPAYFAALKAARVIRADDAARDAATAELTDYLSDHQIGALLDAPVRSRKEIAGVLCVEHVGGTRRWSDDEARFVGSLSDLATIALVSSERAEAEIGLARAQKLEALSRLAGGVTHEFNNLLTVINGGIEIVTATADLDPDSARIIRLVGEAGQRAVAVTQHLLAFGRRQVLELAPTSLKQLALQVEAFAERVVRDDIAVTMELLGPDRLVSCDAGRIEQVLLNLIVNASEAMPDGGDLGISVNTRDEESARITVSDTGRGMSRDVLDHAFEPFFTTKPDAGTGLGLSVSLGIVEQHGGRLLAESKPGSGSSFTVVLPVAEGAAAPAEDASERPTSINRNLKILVAEDEPEVRKMIEMFLSHAGYRPVVAADARHALELLTNQQFDLLISDVIMPEIRGPELYNEARKNQQDLRALFISGYTEEVLHDLEGVRGEYAYLPKPFSIRDLTQAIGRVS